MSTQKIHNSSIFIIGYRYGMKHGRPALSVRKIAALHPEYDANEIAIFGNAVDDARARDDFRYALALGNIGIPAV